MGRLPVATLLSILVVGSQAYAASGKNRPARQTLALAPAQADGTMAKSALDAIDRALASHAGANGDVVGTKALDKRARPDFSSAVRQCKRDEACLNRLGKSLRVDLLLVPVAKPETRGTSLVIHVTGDKPRKVTFVFVTSADLNAALLANASALFGDGAMAPPAEEDLAALPLEPPPLEPAVEPKPETPVALIEPTIVPTRAAVTADSGVMEPPPLDDSIVVRREEPLVTWKTYIGTPAAVLGAAAATYGILQYAHHKSLVNDANGNPNLTQREAAAIDDDAQGAYDRSQIAVFVGTPLLVMGAALVVWDLFVDDHNLGSSKAEELSFSVMPDGRGGGAGSLGFRF